MKIIRDKAAGSKIKKTGSIFAIILILVLAGLALSGGEWGTVYGQTVPLPPTGSQATTRLPELENPFGLTVLGEANVSEPGQTLKFTLFFINRTASSTGNGEIVDELIPGLTVKSATTSKGTASWEENRVKAGFPGLAPGEKLLVTIVATVDQSFKASAVSNSASFSLTFDNKVITGQSNTATISLAVPGEDSATKTSSFEQTSLVAWVSRALFLSLIHI